MSEVVTYRSLSGELLPAEVLGREGEFVAVEVKVAGKAAMRRTRLRLTERDEGERGACFRGAPRARWPSAAPGYVFTPTISECDCGATWLGEPDPKRPGLYWWDLFKVPPLGRARK